MTGRRVRMLPWDPLWRLRHVGYPVSPRGYRGLPAFASLSMAGSVGCWDHARRKFVEASKAAPAKRKGAKVSKADVAIGKIRKLYAIEKRIRDLDPEEKTRQRQQQAQPVLDDLKAWLEKNVTRVPRNSLTYQAAYSTPT